MTVEEIIEETIEQPQPHSDEASLSVTTNSDQASKRKMIPESDKEKSKRPRYETKSSQKETILDDECQNHLAYSNGKVNGKSREKRRIGR